MRIHSKDFRVRSGKKARPQEMADDREPYCKSKEQYQTLLEKHIGGLSELQQLHYASNRYALLLIFQGMDAAGKDGAIRHVMSGVNPQGCEVSSFKQPSAEELEHDFLWRTTRRLPERGQIGIFNRSYYEEVLVVRVHPEILRSQGFRKSCATRKPSGRSGIAPSWTWKATFIATERGPSKYSSTFPRKNSESDFSSASMSRTRTGNSASRTFTRGNTGSIIWRLMRHCLNATSTHHAPWYVVPADDKENARLIVSQIVLDALNELKMAYPKTTAKRRRELELIRRQLKREK